MIRGDVEPISHQAPLPRIAINDRVPVTKEPAQTCAYPYCGCMTRCFMPDKEHAASPEEAARIWALVKGAAEGSNISGAEQA